MALAGAVLAAMTSGVAAPALAAPQAATRAASSGSPLGDSHDDLGINIDGEICALGVPVGNSVDEFCADALVPETGAR